MEILKFYFKRIYRISLSFQKQENLFWKDLKKLHLDEHWSHSIYDNDKYIVTTFEIGEGQLKSFYYMVYDAYFHCTITIIEDYPIDRTTDLFVLAAHFNNLLSSGVVIVDVSSNSIVYHQKRDLLIPLLDAGELYTQINRHYTTSKDIFSGFQRLIFNNEEPVMIIADIMSKNQRVNKD
jgi:hypothetical protein